MKTADLKQLVASLIGEVMAIKAMRDHPQLTGEELEALIRQMSSDFFDQNSDQSSG